MSHKNYLSVTTFVFAVITIVHLLRILMGWDVVVDGWLVPTWISYAGVVVAGFLAYSGFNFSKKK